MSYLNLTFNNTNPPVNKYGRINNLKAITERNTQRFIEYGNQSNRVFPNQNPLVKFLLLFSINPEWSKDHLINVIKSKVNQYASQCGFVSLYNKGVNLPLTLFPELNHNTLIVVPYNDASSKPTDHYFEKELNELIPLYTIYTTDNMHRWDITKLLDSSSYQSEDELYSIIQMDPYALIIGFYRWLQLGRKVGNSPHSYLRAFPLHNLYLYHNEYINFNILDPDTVLKVEKPKWVMENYTNLLKDYTQFKHKHMLTEKMKSFTHYYCYNEPTNPLVHSFDFVFPYFGKSLYFIQLDWVWTLHSLGMVERYLDYNNYLGTVDRELKTALDRFFRFPSQRIFNQFAHNPKWEKLFKELYFRIKNKA